MMGLSTTKRYSLRLGFRRGKEAGTKTCGGKERFSYFFAFFYFQYCDISEMQRASEDAIHSPQF